MNIYLIPSASETPLHKLRAETNFFWLKLDKYIELKGNSSNNKKVETTPFPGSNSLNANDITK